jgi:hypothetical protein
VSRGCQWAVLGCGAALVAACGSESTHHYSSDGSGGAGASGGAGPGSGGDGGSPTGGSGGASGSGTGGTSGAAGDGGAGADAGISGSGGSGGGDEDGGPACLDGSKRCEANTPQECRQGAWVPLAPCPATAPACSNGACAVARFTGGFTTAQGNSGTSSVLLREHGFEFAPRICVDVAGTMMCATGGFR